MPNSSLSTDSGITTTPRPGRLSEIRAAMRAATLEVETGAVRDRIGAARLTPKGRQAIVEHAVDLIRAIRASSRPSIMQGFLAEYGLSTREGVALMCLGEALLRIPDTETIDALIEDKIGASDWQAHLGHSRSSLVNASTWALLLTGRVLSESERGLAGVPHEAIRRLGEPVIRAAVAHAMREMGRYFVFGRDMGEAIERAVSMESKGYSFSYDMLGEAARTEPDAHRHYVAYSDSIGALGGQGPELGLHDRPGVSVKLSALHARYEFGQRDRVMTELVARLRSLALRARSAGIGLTVDAEEADRLDLSLDVIEAVLEDSALSGWDGFGVVVQAYCKRAPHVIDWFYELAGQLDRRIMIRLVKGAYWDSEIKRAQVLGLTGFPVFTRKASTDVSYLACTRKLLGMTDRIYPQFATHNAHTMAAVVHMADDLSTFEFQRLHGMSEALHEAVREAHGVRSRIYAPVGAHRDLLAYLVRRLLENGSNSSFVNQILDENVTAEDIARDPISAIERLGGSVSNPRILPPADIYLPQRRNSKGWDLTDPVEFSAIETKRDPFRSVTWQSGPLIAGTCAGTERCEVRNPACPDEIVGYVTNASPADIEAAIEAARTGAETWASMRVEERANRVRRVADLYEEHAVELFALAAREAGKTWIDCVGEIREACDFARFYASEAIRECGGGRDVPRGVIVCISPWNFPLAIFSGQVLAALAVGNAVIAKPAEQTPLIAARAVALMHEAGIPQDAVQLLPGDGATVGAALVSDSRIDGVCFTGSTESARSINRAMAGQLAPDAPLIAETGGLNAMIVDSTALPEQVVRDVVASAFQSAGQRCSALRVLYVQSELEERILDMLFGAVDELRIGDPWDLATDIGPVISVEARDRIEAYCNRAVREGRLLKRAVPSTAGRFVPPTVLRVDGIEALGEEIFGPVLHVTTFDAEDIDKVVDAVNASGYGLTFGLHSRIDDRVQHIVDGVRAGNIYVNRNQIGAVVGSQPFGGEAESGTGPKAGGPHYVRRLIAGDPPAGGLPAGQVINPRRLQAAVCEAARSLDPQPLRRIGRATPSSCRTGGDGRAGRAGPIVESAADKVPVRDDECAEAFQFAPRDLPGPTGESNRLRFAPRGVVLCLGPGADVANEQLEAARNAGNAAVVVANGVEVPPTSRTRDPGAVLLNGQVAPDTLAVLDGIGAVACSADRNVLVAMRRALASRPGPILPLITDTASPERYVVERHVCVDTTSAGGNASLLAESEP